MKDKFYCYICGKRIGKKFFIWSLNGTVDRVFLSCSDKCNKRMGEPAVVVEVRRVEKRKHGK